MKEKENFNILVVDDEVQLCKSIAMLLELEDYNVQQANSGNQALELIINSSKSIDFVISDIRMPDGQGNELLMNLRKKDPNIPYVLLMTGQSEFTEEEAVKEGAIAILREPIDFDLAISLIEKSRLNS